MNSEAVKIAAHPEEKKRKEKHSKWKRETCKMTEKLNVQKRATKKCIPVKHSEEPPRALCKQNERGNIFKRCHRFWIKDGKKNTNQTKEKGLNVASVPLKAELPTGEPV